jgi:hypothetical protein
MNKNNNIDQLLINLNACQEARDWAKGKSFKEILNTCHRGDWLLWLFQKTNPDDIRLLTLAKGYCAKTVIHLMRDKRSKDAVKAAIKYGQGLIELVELNTAANAAAYAAAYTAYAAADTANAANAAYAAADTANAAADTAANAAAYAAAYAAYATADAAAKVKNQLLTANICRKYLTITKWNINN